MATPTHPILSTAERNRVRREYFFNRSDERLASDQRRYFPDGHADCRVCGQHLPLDAFDPARHTAKGIFLTCSSCHQSRTAL
jgi:hypothetical protein